MNDNTWILNKIQCGMVGNSPTMNHFKIMVLRKELNFLMPHYLV